MARKMKQLEPEEVERDLMRLMMGERDAGGAIKEVMAQSIEVEFPQEMLDEGISLAQASSLLSETSPLNEEDEAELLELCFPQFSQGQRMFFTGKERGDYYFS